MLSAAEKAECDLMINDAPATFGEYITIFKSPVETNNSETNFNFAFAGQKGESTYTVQSGRFFGTIEYTDEQDNQYIKYHPADSLAATPKGFVRLSVSGTEAREFLSDARVIKFDGMNFKPASDLIFRGLFSRDIWTDCWLNKIDNGTL